MNRNYTELMRLGTFEERFQFLALHEIVGAETFGFDRWLNQVFYRTPEWKKTRRDIIIRDNGCDLAIPERIIVGEKIIVHHIDPITVDDIKDRNPKLFDPENLITVSDSTHRALTYGDESLLIRSKPIERHANDTCPWR